MPFAQLSIPVPLIVLLHGSKGTGAEVLRESHLAVTANRHGFMLVVPDGDIVAERGYVWNISGVPMVTGALPSRDVFDDVGISPD